MNIIKAIEALGAEFARSLGINPTGVNQSRQCSSY